MSNLEIRRQEEIVTLALRRGKVNAINAALVQELRGALDELVIDQAARALILTGEGGFFSFGLDVPELFPLSEEDCARFLTDFTGLYTRLYTYPKPVIAAINGHAVAGGCMLALACDRRVMVAERGKIGLNEITFGSSIFAGSTEMLAACCGRRQAEEILMSGRLYEPAEALRLGLVDRLAEAAMLPATCLEEARSLAARAPGAYASLKRLLRGPVAERMRQREPDSIRDFVKIWYSEETREKLRAIEIRG